MRSGVYNTGTLYGEWHDGTPFEGNRYVDRFVVRCGKIVLFWETGSQASRSRSVSLNGRAGDLPHVDRRLVEIARALAMRPRVLLLAVGLCVLPYWAVFVLAGFSDENKPARSWRVWVAWLLITYPFAGLYLMMFFGDRTDAASGTGYAVIALRSLSPVFTLVGAVAGYLLWLLYQWLRTRFGRIAS